MKSLLDAGALIALERNDRLMWDVVRIDANLGPPLVTHAGVLAQVWRATSRQARLSVAVAGMRIQPLDTELAKSAGRLLRVSGTNDPIDAALVVLANHGDAIYTSDPDDMALLAKASDLDLDIVQV